MGEKDCYTEQELEKFTEIAAEPAIKKKNAKKITKDDILTLYRKSVGCGK